MVRGVGAALATIVFLAFAGPASAAKPKQTCKATPQQIYRDLADNGRLDQKYCAEAINRALHSPSLQGYERPAPVRRPQSTFAPTASDNGGSLPFSGLDLALFGGVGAPLLLLGASLGRLARVKPEAIDG
jgi:hypothetical protein